MPESVALRPGASGISSMDTKPGNADFTIVPITLQTAHCRQ